MSAAPPPGVQRDFPLARLTTVRTGRRRRVVRARRHAGDAARAARVGGRRRRRRERGGVGLEPARRRRGRARAWCSSSTGELAAIEVEGPRIAVRRRRAPAGGRGARRSGGAVGHRVRRQHPRHGRRGGAHERQRLRRRARAGARVGGDRRRGAGSSGARPPSWASPTAARTCAAGRSSLRARMLLERGRAARTSRRRSRRCAAAATRPSRRASGRSARRSRTPRTRAQRAAARGCCWPRRAATAWRVGGARFAPKHANFIENTGGATTADVLAVMAEGRRRVLERFGVELEPEVQTLGDVRIPWR